jgi:membrane-associated phospholipid phosphatase
VPLRRLVLVAALGVCLGIAPPVAAKDGRPSAVTPWIELEVAAIASHRVNPPRASRALALASRAMYEASSTRGGARDAAVAGAASVVLRHVFPDQGPRIDELSQRVLAGARNGERARQGFSTGEEIGRGMVARAASDRADAVWTGTPPVGPGSWVPTPPALLSPPVEPLAGTWRPWNLSSGSQFRPPSPPAFGSPEFLAEMQQVYTVSHALTTEQKRIADHWADGAGTVTPPGHWNVIALELVREARWGTRKSARLFAALNTAQADAFIAAWDAKYAYWSVRPISAIRALLDPTWLSHIVTPPFPSYVSGHSTTSGAASTVLGVFFREKAQTLAAMAEEAAVSRLYGGIHFESDNEVGLELGRRVGAVAVAAYRARGRGKSHR